MLCSNCCHVAAAVLPTCLPACLPCCPPSYQLLLLPSLPSLAAVCRLSNQQHPELSRLPCLPACRYTTLLICAPFWYMMRVLVMRHQQKARGGFAAEDEYQRPKGKAAAEPAESDSPLGGKSPTTSSVFKIDSEQGSGELPPAAP